MDFEPASAMDGYLGAAMPGSGRPSVSVGIGKVGNGYIVKLQTSPVQPKPPRLAPSPFVGMDPDELIDRILDGMGALIRTVNDKGAGEDWKDGDDRKQVREAFRVMFPDMARKVDRAIEPVEYIEPRYEHLVFESKEDLLEYLKTNL